MLLIVYAADASNATFWFCFFDSNYKHNKERETVIPGGLFSPNRRALADRYLVDKILFQNMIPNVLYLMYLCLSTDCGILFLLMKCT